MQANNVRDSADKDQRYLLLRLIIAIVVSISLLFGFIQVVKAATSTVELGTADSFALLAGSSITNTGSSVITGDLGLSPGTSVGGFPPGTVSGTQHITDGVAAQAQTDLVTAYNDAAGRTPVSSVPAELGGTTKTDGVYTSNTAVFQITGTLTLDGQGDPDSVFIFKTTETLTTATASTVNLINGAQACHVFWEVGSSATLGTDSLFSGNILALTSVTLNTRARVTGRVLTRNAAITLDSNIVTLATCLAVSPTPTPTVTVTPTATATATPTASPTSSATPTATSSPTATASPTSTVTVTIVPTITIEPTTIPEMLAVTSGKEGSQGRSYWVVFLLVLSGISTFTVITAEKKVMP